ncbi:MAG: hypothetical protein IT372_33230, partial [Polyangiaceae bacterium]|nr:hypothetical protein [Polyangiaceae bacterium]
MASRTAEAPATPTRDEGAAPPDPPASRASDELAARASLRRARRVIVKIGSKSLAGDAWDRLAAEVAALRDALGPQADALVRKALLSQVEKPREPPPGDDLKDEAFLA